MAKAVLLTLESSIIKDIEEIRDKYSFEFLYMKALEQSDTGAALMDAVKAGADIIVTYGFDASSEVKNSKTPLISISLSWQNLIVLSEEAKIRLKKENIENAMDKAELLSYSIDLEKKNAAESTAYLNGIFHGIIEINKNGEIRRINDYAVNLLGCQGRRIIGKPMLETIPMLGKDTLNEVLISGKQVLSLIIKYKNRDIVTNIEPIVLDREIIGAVINVQEEKRIHEIAEELRKELYAHGFVATMRFNDRLYKNSHYNNLLSQAKKAAGNSAPLLICGEEGTEKLGLAQSIHNASTRSGSGFVEVECDAWATDYLDEMLFGVKRRLSGEYYARSLIDMAEDGTLFINNVEALSPELQYKICNLIRGTLCLNGENRQLPTNIRVIAGTTKDMKVLFKEGKVRSDLFYTLSVQTLSIPPLRDRKEDIEDSINYYIEYYSGMYSKPVSIIKSALEFMIDYKWPGNQRQLDNFCHRIVLLTPRRNIDEAFVRSNLSDMEPLSEEEVVEEPVVTKRDASSVIINALKRNNGSRLETAKELGISTTTLWRKMQKYGITLS